MLCNDPFSHNLERDEEEIDGKGSNALEDDVEVIACLHKSLVLDDVWVLSTARR